VGGERSVATQVSDAVKKFLEKPNVAILATLSPRGHIQATPVWFMYTGASILINTARGRAKLRNVQANSHVTVGILDRENPFQYVQIQGKVVTVDAENGPRDIDRLSRRYMGKPYSYGYSPADTPQNRVSIHIQPDRITSQGV
jgi:PPOX class probable F420-dependent enzyme